ncbi:MAG: hypothetical protein HWD85_12130 [Flavobacteriaceae bacterium]|nr:hypothetical protein [Flavobacteriaceae bacterium]
MIQYVKRNQLNEKKYNACIATSIQSRIYAFSWYLDIVCDNWDVLVFNDYEAVMPLPWKKKFGVTYISQPFFTQQLGVFSIKEITEETILRFLKSIPNKFVKIDLQFNSKNKIDKKATTLKDNFILSVKKPYKELYKDFYKGRKSALKQSKKNLLSVDEITFDDLLKIAQQDYNHLVYTESDYKKLSLLSAKLKSNDQGFLLGVFTKEKTLVGGAIFLKDNFRITYLFSVMNAKGKRLNAATFLIDSALKEYAGKHYLFDFEGSMNVGIAGFFKSFGAENEKYTQLKMHAVQRVFI